MNKRVAVVSGGNGAIGQGVVDALRQRGVEPVVFDRSASSAAESGTRQLEVDVTNYVDVSRQVATVVRDYGRIDYLICAQGVVSEAPVIDLELSEWERILTVNLTGTFVMCRSVLPFMQQKRFGRIVTFSTGYITRGYANGAHYAAAKAGIAALTKSLALEVAPLGITANCVAPGPVDSPMLEQITQGKREAWEAGIRARIPRGRVAQVSDVVAPVLFFLSDEADYITGQTMHVSGGLYNP
ncbi:SDR family NAD(P)-dependent oxidoreductase [Sulfobacillus harzensis]|uniref:SDR family oxidoreductase n=1 Tax=Sulfobacillus harzensis TaxID=2729629 RepID=A0A7Y0L6C9_9FIRM|nr:SDR family NAD(P)-dependent oxidoreductase [Sulfobacillus harzensis]NMP22749.1 SDR family oxidoreductase [Sulfobacillus harzensis]